METRKRIMITIILAIMFLLPVCTLGQQAGASPFGENNLPSTQVLESPKQAPFDNQPLSRAPGGPPPGSGGGTVVDSDGGVGFQIRDGAVLDAVGLLCILAIIYGLYKKKKLSNCDFSQNKSE